MNKKTILDIILGQTTMPKVKSTLQVALTQARRLIGFNPKNEGANHCNLLFRTYELDMKACEFTDDQRAIIYQQNSNYEEHDVVTSTILYLIILDQLGHIFGSIKSNNSNRVKDAINNTSFRTILSEEQKTAIKNMRNSLCHNMGLASYNPGKKKLTHRFTLLFDETNKKNIKDGICIKEESGEKIVSVNIFALCNMTEDILKEYVVKHRNGKITSEIDNNVFYPNFIFIPTFQPTCWA